MSEYTHVYLRKKEEQLLEFRDYSQANETEGKSNEEILALYREREEYNDKVLESFGCLLFYLCTIPSRQLEELPWTESPRSLTFDLLEKVLRFYDEDIENLKKFIKKDKKKIEQLEARFIRANPDLYDSISQEIDSYREVISDFKEEIENFQFYRSRFAFAKEIMEEGSNAKRYELIYTKC